MKIAASDKYPTQSFDWGDDDYDQPTAEDEAPRRALPVGLGRSSAYDFDQFDAWRLDGGRLLRNGE